MDVMAEVKPKTILVIEDDPGVARLEQIHLKRAGYGVMTVAAPKEALEQIMRGGIDLIVLDYCLPDGATGLEFYKELKGTGCDIPVIMVTGKGDEATVINALRAGVSDFVTKSMEYLDYLPEAVDCVLTQVRTKQALAESEARLVSIIASAMDAIITIDANGRISIFNAAAEKMFCCSADAAIHQPLDRFLPFWSRRFFVVQAMEEGQTSEPIETKGVRADGREFPVEVSVSEVEVGVDLFHTVILRDITERQRGEEERKRAASLLLSTLESTADGILVVDFHGKITSFNNRFVEMWRLPQEALKTREHAKGVAYVLDQLKRPEEFLAKMRKLYSHTLAEGFDLIEFKDGRVFERFSQPQMIDGRPVGRVSSFRDITERKRAEERLHYLALHDALTGLPNRALLYERLSQAMVFAQRSKRQVALLFLDLDRFKIINDSLGHAVGDQLLKSVSERLLGCVRKSNTVSRLGGDEFTVILANITQVGSTARVAQKILDAISRPLHLSGHEFFVTASAGIALYPTDGDNAEALIKNADAAMYLAKERGRNNYQFYTAEMNVAASCRLDMENALRYALERGEFAVRYQPQIDLATNQVIGVKACLCWQRPNCGLPLADEFIRVANETGLMAPIGEWALRIACAQHQTWRCSPEWGLPSSFYVMVNLSTCQFKQKNISEIILRVLKETGLPPRHLVLELSCETMRHPDATVAVLQELKRLGVQLAIDDFGALCSSLYFVRPFPIDMFKMAPSFVRKMTDDLSSREIAASMIRLAHSLKMKVMAEGVETEGQLEFLRVVQCDVVYGRLLGEPESPEALLPLLQ